MTGTILTIHPQSKQGVKISRTKYDQMKHAILEILQENGEMTFTALGEAVSARLAGQFEGSITWYYTTVKLDLEARGVLERINRGSPQRIRLTHG
jgi:DNA-binding Lrp family transcriptional regulator